MDFVRNLTSDENTVRDDQACFLVLACATFRNIPEKILGKCNTKKYLFYGQEIIGHARWLTTASGYLRLKLFDIYDLSSEQQASLNQIVQFIVDAYVLSFFEICFKPTAIDGPRVVLNIREYLKASSASLPSKKCFIDHAYTWMNPKTAALGVLQADMDIFRIAIRTPNTKELLRSNRPLKAFLSTSSRSSPCLTSGSKND